ncbi:hypothetical protein BD626DRAFT_513676 [Schizophyllum amplum]|uniref:Uncharacterized protein n=1 Tax=Schizophyllum amplum TaxID=97359 RepID=A0A550BZ61_9AGAR|nr:hypothetical protein BD626DRAFT_513676 [Auriculariopsis ampla]
MPSSPGPPIEVFIDIQQWTTITVGFQMAFYGVHVALFLMSLSALYHRSPRNVALRAATTAIFVCASISFIGWMPVYVIQIALRGRNPPLNALRTLDGVMVAGLIAERIMLLISDMISAWRAWVIWMRNRHIAVLLVICLLAITLCSTLEVALYVQGVISGNRHFAQATRILLTIIPGLITNIVTTALVAYRTWIYRRLAKAGSAGNRRRAPNRVERMLILLAESGALYVLLWGAILAVYMHTYVAGQVNNGLANLIQLVVGEGTALIPTMVIIAVALQRSQADPFATLSGATLSRSIHFRTGANPLVVDTDSRRGSLDRGAESHAGSSPACENSKDDVLDHAESTAVDDTYGILLRPMGGQRVLDSVDTGTDTTVVNASVGGGTAAARTGGSRRQSSDS